VALHESLEELPPEDRFVLTRLFFDGRSVTQVARELGLDQRPLYRRRDRLLSHLRNALEAKGLTWPDGGDGDSG
jgi:DNA-directed RNA polymerase specialized sigma24 family protein